MIEGSRQASNPETAPQPGATLDFPGIDVIVSVLVVFNFAVAGPMLDSLARNLDLFTTRSAPRVDVVGLVLLLTVIVPLGLGALVRGLYAVHRMLGLVIHAALLTGLLALLAAQLLERITGAAAGSAVVLVGIAVAAGAAVAWSYLRSAGIRSFVRLGVIAPVGFALLFSFFTPARSLLSPAEAAEGASVDNPVPVVMIVFDGLPAVSLMDADRRIDAALFPNFARLADDATWFRNATTHHIATRGALPGMLTGNYPDFRGGPPTADYLPVVHDFPANLFTILGSDYRMVAHEPVTALCPETACARVDGRRLAWHRRWPALLRDAGLLGLHVVLPQPMRAWLPPPEQAIGDFAGGQRKPPDDHHPGDGEDVAWSEFLAELEPAGRPSLYFFHSMKPHYPWISLPTGQEAYPPRTEPHGGYVRHRWDDDWVVIAQWQRQLLQAGYADRMLGELLDTLERVGIYDDALLLVLADHGEAFTVGEPIRAPSPGNLGEVALPAVFVKMPGQNQAEVVDQPVELVDVLPTILDVVEAEHRSPADGSTLLAPRRLVRERRITGWDDYTGTVSPSGDELLAPLERKLRLFGSEGGWERLFNVGRHGGLVGQDLSDLVVEDGSDVTVAVDGLERLRNVEPDADRLPVLLMGRVRAGAPLDAPMPVAVALNGRIATVAETYGESDRSAKLFVVLPMEALARGDNRVEILRIVGVRGSPMLQRVKLVGSYP